METKIFQEIEGTIREAHLEANCLRPEDMLVKKFFDETAINGMRRDWTNAMIEIKKKEDELKKLKDAADVILKPIKENCVYLRNNITTGYVEVKQQVYLFDEQETGFMGYYDNTGELVHSRRLTPEERQTRVKRDNVQA